jgi:hypothetical protein
MTLLSLDPQSRQNRALPKLASTAADTWRFFFARQVGIGATAQFAGTSVELPGAGGDTRDVKVAAFAWPGTETMIARLGEGRQPR